MKRVGNSPGSSSMNSTLFSPFISGENPKPVWELSLVSYTFTRWLLSLFRALGNAVRGALGREEPKSDRQPRRQLGASFLVVQMENLIRQRFRGSLEGRRSSATVGR